MNPTKRDKCARHSCYDFPRNPLFSSVSPCLPLWLTCHSSHLDTPEIPPHSPNAPSKPALPDPPPASGLGLLFSVSPLAPAATSLPHLHHLVITPPRAPHHPA